MPDHPPLAATGVPSGSQPTVPAAGGDIAVERDPLALFPSLNAGEVLRRIGLSCRTQIAKNEDDALAGLSDGVHRMRVGVRRLRAVLSAFGPFLSKPETQPLGDELRWLGEVLGRARNLDVFADMLGEPGGDLGPGALDGLATALRESRTHAYMAVEAAIRSSRYRELQTALVERFEALAAGEGGALADLAAPIGEIAPVVLDRRRRDAKKLGRGFTHQDATERHQLRIALKKLRYACELLGDLYDIRAVDKFVSRLKRLQDRLGEAHDVLVAEETLAELAPEGGPLARVRKAGQKMLHDRERCLAADDDRQHKHLEQLLAADPFWR